ncbi:hypothetical protein [Methanoregula sp.]|jgi:hypothetical protein|uniref:hypothetical protein n=1 Tax=Methanoregula sp. TaxID=2052170 RepID=UPI0035650111
MKLAKRTALACPFLFVRFQKEDQFEDFLKRSPIRGSFEWVGGVIGGWIEPGLDGLMDGDERENPHIRIVFKTVFVAMVSLVLTVTNLAITDRGDYFRGVNQQQG